MFDNYITALKSCQMHSNLLKHNLTHYNLIKLFPYFYIEKQQKQKGPDFSGPKYIEI